MTSEASVLLVTAVSVTGVVTRARLWHEPEAVVAEARHVGEEDGGSIISSSELMSITSLVSPLGLEDSAS